MSKIPWIYSKIAQIYYQLPHSLLQSPPHAPGRRWRPRGCARWATRTRSSRPSGATRPPSSTTYPLAARDVDGVWLTSNSLSLNILSSLMWGDAYTGRPDESPYTRGPFTSWNWRDLHWYQTLCGSGRIGSWEWINLNSSYILHGWGLGLGIGHPVSLTKSSENNAFFISCFQSKNQGMYVHNCILMTSPLLTFRITYLFFLLSVDLPSPPSRTLHAENYLVIHSPSHQSKRSL